jgi:E3 ubiquitin-protein ligase RGLG
MGSFCSKENQPGGRQPHDYNRNHNQSNGAATTSRGGKDRYAQIGDDYQTLEQVGGSLIIRVTS